MPEPLSELHRIVENAHDIGASTKERYLRDLDQWIEFAGADAKGWTRRRAAEFYTKLLERMLPQSANRLMAGVGYASRWWAHFESNPALDFAKVQAAKPKGKKIQAALSEDAVRRLLGACDSSPRGIRDFAMIVVWVETGMRQMSLAGMTIEDTLLGPGPRSAYPAAFVPLKGKDPAWVPLSDTAVAAIKHWLDALGQLRARTASEATAGPLFRPIVRRIVGGSSALVAETRALTRAALANILNQLTDGADLPHVNPHLWRHTFVTWRTAAGAQPHEIAAITHHDLRKATGALGGYIDARVIGGQVRNRTPPWLAELVRERCACSSGSTS